MQVLEPATRIAHYYLLRRIARGGMSHVYLAQDIFTEQLVALKLVESNHSEHCERLQREIRALTELRHNHILPTLDYGPYQAWHYLVTPYIKHGTLRERLARDSLTLQKANCIFEQIASALQFAHEHGVIHRDVKPSNILLHDGEYVYLTDFGLVKLVDEASDITQTGCMLGTPTYMAPELIEHDATIRSDIYALGVLLYQMLTGRVPFESTTPIGVYWKHRSVRPLPPSMHNPAIPPAIDAVVLHALEKDPLQRFSSVLEFAQSYQQAIVEARTITHPTTQTQPTGTGFITSTLAPQPVGTGFITSVLAPQPVGAGFITSVLARKRSKEARSTPTRIVREAAVLLVGVIFFFMAPLWLGFAYYSFRYRPQLAVMIHESVPLTVDHLPAMLDFPPIPPLKHHQMLPTITVAPAPPDASSGSSWTYELPPPDERKQKHQVEDKQKHKDGDKQKHKDGDTQKQRSGDTQKQEQQGEDAPTPNLIKSYPDQSNSGPSNMPHNTVQHVQLPDVRALWQPQIP